MYVCTLYVTAYAGTRVIGADCTCWRW